MTGERDNGDRGELARSLLALRRAAGLNQIPFAEALGVSQAQVSRVELGRRIIGPELIERWCDLCNATTADRERVMALAKSGADARDLRVVFQRSAAGANYFQERVREHERAAAVIRAFQPGMVLGQLQTLDYAAAVFGAGEDLSPAEVVDLVAERRRRWTRIDDGDGQRREWRLIQTEGALNWCLRSPTLMAEQVEHIGDLSRLPNVRVGIIPGRMLADVVAPHGFHLYDEAAVQVGTKTATGLLTEPADVTVYVDLFAQLEALAVYDDAARAVLARIAAEYRAQG